MGVATGLLDMLVHIVMKIQAQGTVNQKQLVQNMKEMNQKTVDTKYDHWYDTPAKISFQWQ